MSASEKSELTSSLFRSVRSAMFIVNRAFDESSSYGAYGNYHTIVFAPNSCQEMCDLTFLAFEMADRFRNPAIVMTDGFIGQMMEPVEFPTEVIAPPAKPWPVRFYSRTGGMVPTTDELL